MKQKDKPEIIIKTDQVKHREKVELNQRIKKMVKADPQMKFQWRNLMNKKEKQKLKRDLRQAITEDPEFMESFESEQKVV